jgi:hypothetical protein
MSYKTQMIKQIVHGKTSNKKYLDLVSRDKNVPKSTSENLPSPKKKSEVIPIKRLTNNNIRPDALDLTETIPLSGTISEEKPKSIIKKAKSVEKTSNKKNVKLQETKKILKLSKSLQLPKSLHTLKISQQTKTLPIRSSKTHVSHTSVESTPDIIETDDSLPDETTVETLTETLPETLTLEDQMNELKNAIHALCDQQESIITTMSNLVNEIEAIKKKIE